MSQVPEHMRSTLSLADAETYFREGDEERATLAAWKVKDYHDGKITLEEAMAAIPAGMNQTEEESIASKLYFIRINSPGLGEQADGTIYN